jgi:hypothetical protein
MHTVWADLDRDPAICSVRLDLPLTSIGTSMNHVRIHNGESLLQSRRLEPTTEEFSSFP